MNFIKKHVENPDCSDTWRKPVSPFKTINNYNIEKLSQIKTADNIQSPQHLSVTPSPWDPAAVELSDNLTDVCDRYEQVFPQVLLPLCLWKLSECQSQSRFWSCNN